MKDLKLQRIVLEVFGGCNYTCRMCPQSNPGRGKNFSRKMPIDEFEKILDKIVPKYGKPLVTLEGSGEPTMAKDLDKYIVAVKRRGLKCFMNTNGAALKGEFMQRIIDAGIDLIRFSITGYNRETYQEWMNTDNFQLILANIIEAKKYIDKVNNKCKLYTHHLINNNNNITYEIEQYKKNIINRTGCLACIWKMHNWSGNYKNPNSRIPTDRKSCGRPFAPELTVRAGGDEGRTGAVVPCCQTMGQPNEAKSILGHLDNETFEEVYFGKKYENLRKAHEAKDFDSIDYCKDCDQLYQNPEVLVWSNDKSARVNHLLGTDNNFTLTDFNSNKRVF